VGSSALPLPPPRVIFRSFERLERVERLLLAAAGLSFSMSCLPAIGWSLPDDGALVLAALVVLAPTAADRPTSRQTILRVMRIMTTSSVIAP